MKLHRKRPNPLLRLGKDEEGAVMMMTIILAYLLVKVALTCFNVGVLVSERIRLQMATDAASYSSAVWQARFLNYCAYSRRAIIADYAEVPLITAMKTNYDHVKYYYEKRPIVLTGLGCINIPSPFPGCNPDSTSGIPRMTVNILKPLYDLSKGALFDGSPIGGDGRECSEHLAKMHAVGQKALYFYTSLYWLTVVPEVVKQANKPIGTATVAQIDIPASYALAMSGLWASQRGILNDKFVKEQNIGDLLQDIEVRKDDFTAARIGFLPPRPLPFFASRYYWAFGPPSTTCAFFCDDPAAAFFADPRVDFLTSGIPIIGHIGSLGVIEATLSFTSKQSKSKDEFFFGAYSCGDSLDIDFECDIPCHAPIVDPFVSHKETYTLQYGASDIKLYKLAATGSEFAFMEPSVYSALRIKKTELSNAGGGGRMFNFDNGLPLAERVKDVLCISRAKVFFQGFYSGGDKFMKPNMYYPYWEAQLAPIFGPGLTSANTILQTNGTAILTAMRVAGDFDMPPTGIVRYLPSITH